MIAIPLITMLILKNLPLFPYKYASTPRAERVIIIGIICTSYCVVKCQKAACSNSGF